MASVTSLDTIASFAQTFNMPYMTHSIAESNPYNPTDYVIYMRPSYTQALVDVIVHSEWEHVFFIYDSDEGDFFKFPLFFG